MLSAPFLCKCLHQPCKASGLINAMQCKQTARNCPVGRGCVYDTLVCCCGAYIPLQPPPPPRMHVCVDRSSHSHCPFLCLLLFCASLHTLHCPLVSSSSCCCCCCCYYNRCPLTFSTTSYANASCSWQAMSTTRCVHTTCEQEGRLWLSAAASGAVAAQCRSNRSSRSSWSSREHNPARGIKGAGPKVCMQQRWDQVQ